MIITAKILSAVQSTDKVSSTIEIEFDDGKGRWRKTYTVSQQVVSAQLFKEKVISDVKNDLKVNRQLDEIKPIVGKTFTFEV